MELNDDVIEQGRRWQHQGKRFTPDGVDENWSCIHAKRTQQAHEQETQILAVAKTPASHRFRRRWNRPAQFQIYTEITEAVLHDLNRPQNLLFQFRSSGLDILNKLGKSFAHRILPPSGKHCLCDTLPIPEIGNLNPRED
ncbi:MAG TPA: hypothetical protein VIV82_08490 [Verrucomicrobiae bacterium]